MDAWLADLIDGLEHSTPQGREEAAGLRTMADDMEALEFERTALRAERDEMIEALKLADALLSGANMNVRVVERKVRATIAKASPP